MSLKVLKSQDEWAKFRCDCGEVFEVNACYEENLVLRDSPRGYQHLIAKCPNCGYEENNKGILSVYNKVPATNK